MTDILILNPEEQPVKTNHISWRVTRENLKITLYEVVERFYRHPQAPDNALIQRIEIDRIISYKEIQPEAAALLLFDWSSTNLKEFVRHEGLI